MSFHSLQVLITAGPTYEPIDPVRFVGNRSSGKMGFALAEEWAARGAQVLLIHGPVVLKAAHPAIKTIAVETAAQMYEAVMQHLPAALVAVFAAAVADYTPAHPAPKKIKKEGGPLTLELVKTKDIALEAGKQKGQRLHVGFALETDSEEMHAQQKLQRKNFDLVVLNSLNDAGAGFQHDTNRITLLDRLGRKATFDLKPKAEVARDIVDYIKMMLDEA